METKQTAFRLGADTLEQLEFLRIELKKKDRTDTIKAVIQEVYDRYTLSDTVTTDSYTPDTNTENSPTRPTDSPTLLEAVIDTLKDQLTVKDQQIERLSQALLNAQDQGKAAQALNAMDKAPALPVIAGGQAEQPTPADPPIGEMTFRQLFRTWRKARK